MPHKNWSQLEQSLLWVTGVLLVVSLIFSVYWAHFGETESTMTMQPTLESLIERTE